MGSNDLYFTIKKLYPLGYSSAVSYCRGRLEKEKKTAIFTPNAEMLSHAVRSDSMRRLLQSADLLFPDGIGVHTAMRFFGFSHSRRTAGIELAEGILHDASRRGYKVFLLGGEKGVAEAAAHRLMKRYPGLRVCGCHHGYFKKSGKENSAVIKEIDRSGADILFVCFGFPAQESWIAKNLSRLGTVKLAIGLGGSLDVWSGKVARSPKALSEMGLEWLFRAANDPKRIKRLPNLVFFSFFAIKEALFNR